MAENKLKSEAKLNKKSKNDAVVNKADVKALEERLNALEKIQSEKLKPKSEIRTTGKRLFPIVVGGFFALCSGFAVYGVSSAARFYFDYGDVSSLLITLLMLFLLLALIGLATWAVHRSEWGYRLRYMLVLMVVACSALGLGAVLMQGPVERFVDKLGITERLRPEERLFGDSTVYGKIAGLEKDRIEVGLVGGGSIYIKLSEDTRIFPSGARLAVGQPVGVIVDLETKDAKWIRVLPGNHPAGRSII